jgi:hypothetical protein
MLKVTTMNWIFWFRKPLNLFKSYRSAMIKPNKTKELLTIIRNSLKAFYSVRSQIIIQQLQFSSTGIFVSTFIYLTHPNLLFKWTFQRLNAKVPQMVCYKRASQLTIYIHYRTLVLCSRKTMGPMLIILFKGLTT